jgi:ribosome-associated heat shock protein Hsp15
MTLADASMDALRVDLWLWAARFFKTRSLARKAIEGGRISVNDAGCKPAKLLHAGDRLHIGRGEERLVVDVLVLADKRGPASVAATLYEETPASRAAREAAREQLRLVGHTGPDRRPDKHARRQLRDLKDTR